MEQELSPESTTEFTWNIDKDNKLLWDALSAEIREALKLSWSEEYGIVSGHYGNPLLRTVTFASEQYTVIIFGNWTGQSTFCRSDIKSLQGAVRCITDHAQAMSPGTASDKPVVPVLRGYTCVRDGILYVMREEDLDAAQKWAYQVNEIKPGHIAGIIVDGK